MNGSGNSRDALKAAFGLLVNVAEAAMDYVDEMNDKGIADDADLVSAVEALRDAR